MNIDALRQELSEGKLHPVYYLRGEERLLAEEGFRLILEAVLPGPERAFCLTEPNPESRPADIKQALLSPPIFGGRRLVRLRDPDGLQPEAKEVLAGCLGKVPAGIHLAITGQVKEKGDLWRAVKAAATMVDCLPLKRKGDAAGWAIAHAKVMGVALPSDAAYLLVEAVGTDLQRLSIELEKALTYLGDGSHTVTADDLRALLGRDREEDVFKLVEAAASGKAGEALRILDDLLTRGEPEALLLFLLSRQVRQLLIARYLKDRRRSGEIAGVLKVPPFVGNKLAGQAASFSVERCGRLLERMLEADLRSKTGEREPRLELEMVVLSMSGRL